MAKLTRDKTFIASLLSDMRRTIENGEAAVERCLEGKPVIGDEKRIKSYHALASWMLGEGGQSST